jgi:hypothetical protein
VRLLVGCDPVWCTARVLQDGRDATLDDVKVSAVGDAVGPLLGDDIDATFSMANGVIVRYTSRHPLLAVTRQPYALTLTGTGGVVRMAQGHGLGFDPVWEVQRVGEESWRPLATAAQHGFEAITPNERLAADWLSAIQAGDGREPLCSGQRARASMEMVHAVFAAGLSRTRVMLPLQARTHPLAAK